MELVGVREATGKNDGPEVARVLLTVGLGEGYSYCAATNYACYTWAGETLPGKPSDYAWSPTWADASKVVWRPSDPSPYEAVPADVFTLYYPSLKRVGHTGLVLRQEGQYVITFEGNTNADGAREGNGFWIKRRRLSEIHRITRWIRPN